MRQAWTILTLLLPDAPEPAGRPEPAARLAVQEARSLSQAEEELAALEKEYDDAEQAFYQAFREAKTDEERAEIVATRRPDAKAFLARFQSLADANAGTETAARSLVWIALHDKGGEIGQAAHDRLLREHLSRGVIAEVCLDLSYETDAHAGRVLARIAEEAGAADARGKGCYFLARHKLNVAKQASRLRDDLDPAARDAARKAMDEHRLAELDALDLPALEKEAEALFERVVEAYGEVRGARRTLGEMARGDLFEIRQLAVGKVAPEIEAEDLEGAVFKLSDSRGKVVVLDFWGHW